MEQRAEGVQFLDDLIAKVLRYIAINRVLNCQALPIVSQFLDLQSINVRLKSFTLEKKHIKKRKQPKRLFICIVQVLERVFPKVSLYCVCSTYRCNGILPLLEVAPDVLVQRQIGHLDGVIGGGLVVALLGVVVQKLITIADALGPLYAGRVALPPIRRYGARR